jgi:general secretion pathway protein A
MKHYECLWYILNIPTALYFSARAAISVRQPDGKCGSTFEMRPISMYTNFFRLKEPPFSLTPDPRYLYMSEQHREGLAHLLYGVQQPGGFIQLTGEIGCGKTTLCRCLVSQLPPETDIALILNPRLTVVELLAAFCDELRIPYTPGTDSIKVLVDALNRHLLETHAAGRRTVLVIDEAQNLHRHVLEQIRLLTNLETEQEKLLQIILIGQPELLTLLKDPSLRQLAQRITARYHLLPLSRHETYAYIQHRLFIAGLTDPVFSKQALHETYRLTGGVPRLINILCDRALLGAYTLNRRRINASVVRRAGREIRETSPRVTRRHLVYIALLTAFLILLGTLLFQIFEVKVPGLSRIITGVEEPYNNADFRKEESDRETAENASQPSNPLSGSSFYEENPVLRSAGDAGTEPPAAGSVSAIASAPQTSSDLASYFQAGFTGTQSRSTVPFAGIIGDPSLKYSLVSSFNSLYYTWGIPLSIQPTEIGCSAGRSFGFECLFMTGNWLKLRRLDIPAILGIQISNGEKRHATLIGLNGNVATLIIGGRKYSFLLQEIDRIWDGSFILIWKPPFNELNLPLGMQGDQIAWVRQTLDVYEGRTTSSSKANLFDQTLEQRIRDFQKSQSLVEDGRIGPETLIRLFVARDANNIPLLSRYPYEGEKL